MISMAVKAKSPYTKYVEICDVINDKLSSHISSLKYNNLIWIRFHKDSFLNHYLYADVQLYDYMEKLFMYFVQSSVAH